MRGAVGRLSARDMRVPPDPHPAGTEAGGGSGAGGSSGGSAGRGQCHLMETVQVSYLFLKFLVAN